MRNYCVKPIDKVLPRRMTDIFGNTDERGRQCVHVTTHPAFFRAPMLISQIHSQWDSEFCKSTEYQMSHSLFICNDVNSDDDDSGSSSRKAL